MTNRVRLRPSTTTVTTLKTQNLTTLALHSRHTCFMLCVRLQPAGSPIGYCPVTRDVPQSSVFVGDPPAQRRFLVGGNEHVELFSH